MNEYLPLTKVHFFSVLSNRVEQGVRRGALIEKNCVGVFRLGIGEGISVKNGLHLRSRAHKDTYRLAGIRAQTSFKFSLHLRRRGFGLKDHIAARDVGLDARKSGIVTHGLKIGHRELAGSPDIYGAQKCNVPWHAAILSRPLRLKRSERPPCTRP